MLSRTGSARLPAWRRRARCAELLSPTTRRPERSKACAEDDAGIDEIGVGGDSFVQAGNGLVDEGQQEAVREIGIERAATAVADRFAAFVIRVEAALGFCAELALGDLRAQKLGRSRAKHAAQYLGNVQCHVEPDAVSELDRSHRHAERLGRGIDALETVAVGVRVQRLQHIRRQ